MKTPINLIFVHEHHKSEKYCSIRFNRGVNFHQYNYSDKRFRAIVRLTRNTFDCTFIEDYQIFYRIG